MCLKLTDKKTKNGLFDLLPALGLSFCVLVFGVVAVYAPPARGEMAIVFPPGTSESYAYGAIVSSGGKIVGTSRFQNIVVAYAQDEGFRSRILDHGGWFALAAKGLCSSADQEFPKS